MTTTLNASRPSPDGESEAGLARPWPPADLEWLSACPACGGQARRPILEGLSDTTFRVAPGQWTLWRCGDCSAGYLDPRPTPTSIGRAYGRYYTHEAPVAAHQIAYVRATDVKSRLRVGYYNWRYGHRIAGGAPLGATYAALNPLKRAAWDHYIRHLPPPAAPGSAFLDIGCGAGAFLFIAEALGYAAQGLEPDPNAAQAAVGAGLAVSVGGLPDTGLPGGRFDHITLSHVFEHLHDPLASAREVLRLLTPGGRVWFNQPNLDAAGLGLFAEHWRGLEAPRHLVLLNPGAFSHLLTRVGFTDVQVLPPKPNAEDLYRLSVAMADGLLPEGGVRPPSWNPAQVRRAKAADQAARRRPAIAECVTITARRPGG